MNARFNLGARGGDGHGRALLAGGHSTTRGARRPEARGVGHGWLKRGSPAHGDGAWAAAATRGGERLAAAPLCWAGSYWRAGMDGLAAAPETEA